MKKPALLAIVLISIISACNIDTKSYEEISEIENGKYDNLDKQDKRQVKRMYEYDNYDTLFAITDYDKEGRILKVQILESDGSVSFETINKYDENGRLLEMTDGRSDAHELHTYDEKGRLIKSAIRWGTSSWAELYNYIEENKRIKTTVEGKDTIEKGTIETLDEKGRLVLREAEYKYDMGKYTESWKYDKFGNQVDYREVNEKGELQEFEIAEYNPYGLLLHEADGIGTTESAKSWYDYDEQGRRIANKEMRSGKFVSKGRWEYNGNEVKHYSQSLQNENEEEKYGGKDVFEYYE